MTTVTICSVIQSQCEGMVQLSLIMIATAPFGRAVVSFIARTRIRLTLLQVNVRYGYGYFFALFTVRGGQDEDCFLRHGEISRRGGS